MDTPDSDETFMQAAIEEARAALTDDVGGPFGAVVVKDGEIVGRGRNRVLADADPTAHAEVVALRDAARNLGTHELTGCVVYSSCEPCPMCLAAIYWARADRLVQAATREDAAGIGFDDAFLYEEVAKPPAGRALDTDSVARADAAGVMEAWAMREDRTLY